MEKQDLLFKQLFNREVTADSKNFLQQLTQEHPYFSPAQFFLLQHTAKEEQAYKKQLSKTAVLFNNSHWLNYLLLNSILPTAAPVVDSNRENIQLQKNEILPIETDNNFSANTKEGQAQEEANNNLEDIAPTITEETVIASAGNDEKTKNEFADVITSDKQEEIKYTETAQPDAEEDNDRTINYNTEDNATRLNDDAISNFKINLIVPDTTEDTIHFEPLHTTDYFASVGIKLSEEIKPADKLGKQLKSFTEWLKTMKKVHAEDQVDAATAHTDAQIQLLAEKSNTEGEIVTEAMAEVLVQQGRVKKAIELYEKLSLLNPSKSAFFAAKIINLKEQ